MNPANPQVKIGDRSVGIGCPAYIVAELSANHRGDIGTARDLVRAAKAAGADAVKVQTYTPDTMTLASESPVFRIQSGTIWDGKTLHDLYRDAYMPWDWQPELQSLAGELGLDFFSTPFDGTAVEFLEGLRVPAYKIASFELVDIPLIRRVAATGKPMILSTGMASIEEIQEAVDAARLAGTGDVVLLRCASAYPAPPKAANLRAIAKLRELFQVPVGLSDHTRGIVVPVVAVGIGVCLIEKHLTLSRSAPGPDSAFSLEPDEFRAMVESVRLAEEALGSGKCEPGPDETACRAFRRSLFAAVDIKAGEPLTPGNVRSIRPAGGLHPRHYDEIVGRRAARDIPAGTPLCWADIESA